MKKVKLSTKAQALLAKRKQRDEASGEMLPAKKGAPVAAQPAAPVASTDKRVKLPQDAAIVPGVYLNENRNAAIVFAVKQGSVYYLSLHTGSIEAHSASPGSFARDFARHLPNYPMRRAARVYDGSMLSKSTQAQRVITYLLNA